MPIRLDRAHFTVGRAAEYFSAAELEKQTGQHRSRFAAVALKELADNALDAAESIGVAPEIAIEVARDATDLRLSVADNGPGLATEIISRVLDFETRTSDKIGYRAPTRGQQGNALKTVIGLPVALGGRAPLTIDTHGRRHDIRAHVDPAGNAVVAHEVTERPTATGATVAVTLPAAGQHLDAQAWARAYSLVNPHASVKIRVSGEGSNVAYSAGSADAPGGDVYQSTVDFPQAWLRFLPSDPTSPHWYDVASLRSLLFFQISAARRTGLPSPLVRDFVRQFRGLSATAKAKAVCAHLPAFGRLADFEGHDDAIGVLLAAMQGAARPAPPAVLGLVGAEHIRARFAAWHGVAPERFWYVKVLGATAGSPFVVEAAVAETDLPGPLVSAINFSPTFEDPFAGTTLLGGNQIMATGLRDFLSRAHVLGGDHRGEGDPPATAALVHVISPALTFLDRGKTRLAPSAELATAVGEALWRVSKSLYEDGERRKKDAARAERHQQERHKALVKRARADRCTLKEAVFAVMEEAWSAATGGGAMEASARTLFYQARPLVQRYTDQDLTDTYFTQTLLPLFQREIRALPRVYYEPRGTLYEPHTGQTVDLGTREVEEYVFPSWIYDKILFIEKQGLWPPLRTAQLAERYDLAIVAGEGYATEAARRLLARADVDREYRLFVMHDADPAGYNIARTLRDETRRMPGYRVHVIDLGLRFEDGLEMGLQTERFTRRKGLPTGLELTERALQAFQGRPVHTDGKRSWICERIELNAMTSPQLITYIEAGLKQHGATEKVIPPDDVLHAEAAELARSALRDRAHEAITRLIDMDAIIERFLATALAQGITEDAVASVSGTAIAEALEAHRLHPWTTPVGTRARLPVDRAEEAIVAWIAGDLGKRP